jgi:hypothetical protein
MTPSATWSVAVDMLKVDGFRVTDPATLSSAQIVKACARHGQLVVQFSNSNAYDTRSLKALNEACSTEAHRLEVRFYGHYQTGFDASVLAALPEVRTLSIDCLHHITNEDELGRLPNLKSLSFGVFEFDRPDFPASLPLGSLEQLALIETRKRNFNLSALAKCVALRELFINGHSKGISAIATLPRLGKLTLSGYAKTGVLDFIKTMPALESLTLVLGGRPDIDDLTSDTLKTLQILRVKGLSSLGDLSRFPALCALRIEDQLRLDRLDLAGADLQRLSLFNCRNLAELPGLEKQNQLREFSASGVAFNLNDLRTFDWPPATSSVHLFSRSRKWNDDTAAHLASRGLDKKREPWP